MRLGLCLAGALAAAQPAAAAQYWFGGQDPVVQVDKHRDAPADWMAMFAPGAPWQQGLSRLNVFKISAQMALRGTDDMLRTIFTALRQHHVAVAIEMGAVLRSAECGGGEGYAPPDLVEKAAGRLQRLGLTLDYWAMDEPVWFTHEKTWGRNTCAYPIDEVARRVARNVAVMRRYYPAIRIGDIEVLAADRTPPRVLVGDYVAFSRAFEQLTGTRLAFFHADVSWKGDGESVLPLFEREERALGIRTGFIIGGTMQDESSEAWTEDGFRRFQALYDNPATRPDDVIVQSWQPLPDHDLPESQPGAFTHLLLQAESLP